MCAAKILFKLTGSIAAWKACAVISRLVQDGHEVQAVATPAALRFVGAATLEGMTGRPVKSDLWERGTAMDHINLTKWADVVVLCPATANTINRFAAGIADDLVGSLFLAHDWKKPYLLSPAMNPAMWAHPATRAGIEQLRRWGVHVLPVARGRMACGDEGEGRLIEPEEVLAAIRARLDGLDAGVSGSSSRDARVEARPIAAVGSGVRVLVTSGGTEEAIDGVRTLTNFSTGRTGALLADRLAAEGHDVVLLRSHRAAEAVNTKVRTETFFSFADLQAALQRLLAAEAFDLAVHAAAVSDYSVAGLVVNGQPVAAGMGKIGTEQEVSIRLAPNPKLVERLRDWSCNPGLQVVAFKLTRGADSAAAERAVSKLFRASKADAVVHNDLDAIDPASGRFPATLWRADGSCETVDSREALADAVVRFAGEAKDRPTPKAASTVV